MEGFFYALFLCVKDVSAANGTNFTENVRLVE
jgi:hypothetical protein